MRVANSRMAGDGRGANLWWWIALAAALLAASALTRAEGPVGQLTRIKDVATIEGIRDNQLVGYGLVVGLRGTGDSSQTVFPAQTLISTLERMGITVPADRVEQRQQHAGEEHGRGLRGGHAAALQ